MFLAGEKWSSNRAWTLSYTKLLREAFKRGEVVRVQSSYPHHTLWAWAKVEHISIARHPKDVIDDAALREAGCPDMKKEDYIQQFCMRDGVVCMIVTVRFSHLWTKYGVPIARSLT